MDTVIGALIPILLLGSGGYALYTYLRLRREWDFFDNKFLLPGNCPADACQDVDGYLEYISPRLLIFSIACLVFGLLCIPVVFTSVGEKMGLGGTLLNVLNYVVPGVGLAVFVWYMISQSRAAKRFW